MNNLSLKIPSSIWFCGLSGAGKTTVSCEFKKIIENKTSAGVALLDGDELVELFSSKNVDRSEGARTERVKKYLTLVGILLKTPNVIPVVVMINHCQKLRQMVKESPLSGNYFEVFINTSINTCKDRDPKGHYQKAQNKESPLMIGLDLPFDTPENPDIEISEGISPKESADFIFQKLCQKGILTEND